MLWMGVAVDFVDRVVAIDLHDAVGTRFEGVRAQHLFLVRKMTFDVFAIEDRILQHGVFACACRGCTGEQHAVAGVGYFRRAGDLALSNLVDGMHLLASQVLGMLAWVLVESRRAGSDLV